MSEKIEITQKELAKVFTEWERRYREDPEAFQSEAAKLLHETPETYGEACAPYFVFIFQQMRGLTPLAPDTATPAASVGS